jgi:hypothetical protein
MKKKIETFVLFVLIVILTVIIVRNFFPTVIDNVIIKEKEVIKVEGQIQYVDGTTTITKPYGIVLEKIGDDWKLNADLSYMPMEMSVDNVSYKKDFDWLSPVRVGITFDKKPVLCYNIANIKNIEIGVFTDFDSIGADVGYRWRNIVPFVGYTLDGDVHFGVSFKIF